MTFHSIKAFCIRLKDEKLLIAFKKHFYKNASWCSIHT